MIHRATGFTILRLFLFIVCMALSRDVSGLDSPPTVDRDVLSRSIDPSWYSSSEDRLVVVPPRSNQSIVVSDRHDSIYSPTPNGVGATNFFGRFLSDLLEFVFYFSYYIFAFFAIVLGIVGLFALFRGYGPRRYGHGKVSLAERRESEQKRITDLPFDLEPSLLGLREQADRYRGQGDYSSAIVFLFSHVLMQLDTAGHIRLMRGKTNRVYLRELKGREKELGFTSSLVKWFEPVFFGRKAMDPIAFEKLWNQLPAFESYLERNQGREPVLEERDTAS